MLEYYKKLSPWWLCAILFGFLIGCVNTPYTRKIPDHELCQNVPPVNKTHAVRYLTPCLTGELSGRRVFVSQGSGVFSYRYNGIRGDVTGVLKAVDAPRENESTPRTLWRFVQMKGDQQIATFDVERKACTYNNLPFALTFTLTLAHETHSGCGYQIKP
ncbi:MAG: hypothetical protein AAGF06_01740 [Pseudomonadota bacterium]